jgi:putative endonuclease
MNYVYIITNDERKKFKYGFTKNLKKTIHEIKFKTVEEREKYDILVYFEAHEEFEEAKKREKIINMWSFQYAANVIRLTNPDMKDLYPKLFPPRSAEEEE